MNWLFSPSNRPAKLLVLIPLVGAVPALRAQDSAGLHRVVVHGRGRLPEGTMAPNEVKALGNRFVSVRIVPDSVTLRVGDSLSFDSIQLLALDSTGAVLGRLPIFNARMPAGAAVLLFPLGVKGVSSGVSVAIIGVPRPFWFRPDQPPPSAPFRIIVHE